MNNTPPQDIELLFNELYKPLCRYAFTILKRSVEAEDVVQGVFLTFIEKRNTINIAVSARSYLYKMVYHASLNYLRNEEIQKKRHAQLDTTELTVHPDLSKGESELEIRQRIDRVLEQLPPQCRVVFIKSRAENKKYSEIAAEMGLSVKTVEAHMSKALKVIRGLLRVLLLFMYLTEMHPISKMSGLWNLN